MSREADSGDPLVAALRLGRGVTDENWFSSNSNSLERTCAPLALSDVTDE
jgi:hypothetical protein